MNHRSPPSRARSRRLAALAATCAVGLALTGCAVLPARGHVDATHAIPVAEAGATRLGRVAAANLPSAAASAVDGRSGFRLLPQGEFAFNARIALAERAEKSLDLQSYEIRGDAAGRRLLRAARDAADRGVRVLVDDFYAAGQDRLLFVGSMNMDPRSANTNTEMGVFIDSPELLRGSHGAGALRDLLKSSAYELRLAADGDRIEWLEHRPDGTTVVHAREPGLSAWQRFKLRVLAAFVSESLL